jgi:hypothetical protein
MTNFSRDGWSTSIIPPNALYQPHDNIIGWVRGPFGISLHHFVHEEAGSAEVAFLFHRKTGYRLASFLTPALAAEAAELIEPCADWDGALKEARSNNDARDIAQRFIGDRWSEFVLFEWEFDCWPSLTKVWRSEAAISGS